MYICRLAKLNKILSPKVIATCLQLACKFCEVAVEGSVEDFELQFFILETIALFVSEKTYLMYTQSLTSMYQEEIEIFISKPIQTISSPSQKSTQSNDEDLIGEFSELV